MRQLQIINGKTCRMLEPDERLQRGDWFRRKDHPRGGWEFLIRPVPNRYSRDTADQYPKFFLFREIDPLICAMLIAKRKARRRK